MLTTKMGQRSLAEMKAQEVLSEVAYGSAGASRLVAILSTAFLLAPILRFVSEISIH